MGVDKGPLGKNHPSQEDKDAAMNIPWTVDGPAANTRLGINDVLGRTKSILQDQKGAVQNTQQMKTATIASQEKTGINEDPAGRTRRKRTSKHSSIIIQHQSKRLKCKITKAQ